MSEHPFNSHFDKRGDDQEPKWLPLIGTLALFAIPVLAAAVFNLGRVTIHKVRGAA